MPILSNSRHEHFAQRLATGASATQAYIAAGYSAQGAAQSAARLLKTAEVQARVRELQAAISEQLVDCSIRDINVRIRALESRWQGMQRIIAARAADEQMRKAPGGDTGLLTIQYKSIGGGEFAEKVTEYSVDTGLLKEMRAHEQQAAQELGQWADKHEVTGTVELVQRLAAARRRVAAAD